MIKYGSITSTQSAKKFYVEPGQPANSTVNSNIHVPKVMLYVLGDQKDVRYYELLKMGKTINGNVAGNNYNNNFSS